MIKRFIRAIKSLFGGAINSMENPRKILQQNIREMNDQIPAMNENIATVKANMLMMKKQVKRYEDKVDQLSSRIKSAIKADRDDVAESYALKLERAKESLADSREQLQYAEQAYEKAKRVKKAFMKEKDQKIEEAKQAMRASERSEWQAKVADTLEQFEIGGIDATHDEMIQRINENAAKNEARMELAMDNMDAEGMEIEVDAERMRARQLVSQFKKQMDASDKNTNRRALPSYLRTNPSVSDIAESPGDKQSLGSNHHSNPST